MKKNKKIIVVVFVMLLTVSIALAYFVGRTLLDGKGASTTVTTANIHGATLKVEGELNFNAEDMLPGHRDISRIKVTATGNNEVIPYNLVWTGTNTLATNLKFTVYKTSSQIETNSNCKKHDEQVSGGRKLYETCDIKNESQMGEVLTTGTIQSSEESILVELAKDEFINATPDGQIVYYYIIIEYPNEDNDQYPKDKGGSFNGVINAEASDTKSDINIIAAYIEQEDGKYEKTDDIPQEGYIINQEKTVCNNGAKPIWDNKNKGLLVTSFTKSGTECELYFDKIYTGANLLSDMKNLKSMNNCPTIENGQVTVTGIEYTEKLICSASDDDGESYYFRGTTNNNWVKFGERGTKNIWWRIIRINGDGTIRLIYAGEGNSVSENGKNIETANTQYNKQQQYYNDNTSVGYYYGSTGSPNYNNTHSNSTQSTIAEKTETWFSQETNLNETTQLNHIDENAGFCNNRQISSNPQQWWNSEDTANRGTGAVITAYKGFYKALTNNYNWRIDAQYPDLRCSSSPEDYENNADYKRDNYTWKSHAKRGNKTLAYPVGLITMDEVILAGGFGGQNNTGYWLYTGEAYWTISPRNFNGASLVFYVNNDGFLGGSGVSGLFGVRPVINLKSSTKFTFNGTGEKGTKENPYIVTD